MRLLLFLGPRPYPPLGPPKYTRQIHNIDIGSTVSTSKWAASVGLRTTVSRTHTIYHWLEILRSRNLDSIIHQSTTVTTETTAGGRGQCWTAAISSYATMSRHMSNANR